MVSISTLATERERQLRFRFRDKAVPLQLFWPVLSSFKSASSRRSTSVSTWRTVWGLTAARTYALYGPSPSRRVQSAPLTDRRWSSRETLEFSPNSISDSLLYFTLQDACGLAADTVWTNFLRKIIAVREHEAQELVRIVGVELTYGVEFHTGNLQSSACNTSVIG